MRLGCKKFEKLTTRAQFFDKWPKKNLILQHPWIMIIMLNWVNLNTRSWIFSRWNSPSIIFATSHRITFFQSFYWKQQTWNYIYNRKRPFRLTGVVRAGNEQMFFSSLSYFADAAINFCTNVSRVVKFPKLSQI